VNEPNFFGTVSSESCMKPPAVVGSVEAWAYAVGLDVNSGVQKEKSIALEVAVERAALSRGPALRCGVSG
jgi:hypothetical protein